MSAGFLVVSIEHFYKLHMAIFMVEHIKNGSAIYKINVIKSNKN